MLLNLWCQSLMMLNHIYQVNSNSINLKIKNKLVKENLWRRWLLSKDLNERNESYTTERKNVSAESDLVHPKTKDLLQAHPWKR